MILQDTGSYFVKSVLVVGTWGFDFYLEKLFDPEQFFQKYF